MSEGDTLLRLIVVTAAAIGLILFVAFVVSRLLRTRTRGMSIRMQVFLAVGVIVGLPESHLENVLLEDVQIDAAGAGLEVRNAKGVEFKNVKFTAKKGQPVVVKDAEVKGLEK